MECITVCGAKAQIPRNQDEQVLEDMQARFEFLSQTANTPARFTENQTGPNAKRLILDRDNYYASTGGHGACRGCGEVTAIRQITAAAHAISSPGCKNEIGAIEGLLGGLAEKRLKLADEPVRLARIEATVAVLEKRLFDLESGPTGAGPSPMVIANATGCSSVYCSTFPFNSYRDPWVNSLFQDAPALAKGIFEGLAADMTSVVKAARIAELELADSYEPGRHDREFRTLAWEKFTDAELARIPTVISMGGDGANYDIGFGALSKVLTTHAPSKC
jgi:pyruvate-ferredoxin/flavodoxin oxidoreductase